MQSSHRAEPRISSLPGVVDTEEELKSLREHLNDVVEGDAFKGSHRSVQFLKYVVEHAIAGQCDSLKERVIGVELFGRSPSYDTGEDAVVRVTASDVRRRLMQHYGTYGSNANFRIALPQGSYVPEISRLMATPEETQPATSASHSTAAALNPESSHRHSDHPPAETPSAAADKKLWTRSRIVLAVGALLTAINLAVGGSMFWTHLSARAHSPRSIVPWSAFFSSSHIAHLITSDPNVAVVQDMCGYSISVSDYANHNYIPSTSNQSAEMVQFCHQMLPMADASNVDPGIAARVAALAERASTTIDVRAARNIELNDLKTDDNYILLGSPRSNPWSSLFNDQLDFRFSYDKPSNQEFIRNMHPRANELPQYAPTAIGGGTGKSFAIIAVVQNLDQRGKVLLIAGANAEGTEAAGSFATDMPRLSAALQNCGISGSMTQFELLLQVDTMAGSPSNISLVACHTLPGNQAR